MTKSRAQQADTKAQLVEAALEVLRSEGFAGATSRAIARAAGVNQALVFYHFGSVDALLLAALDRTSHARMERYRAAVAEAATVEELAEIATRIYEEDRESGHINVVSQMVAGSLARPELAREVVARMEPWIAFCEEAIRKVVAGSPLEDVLPLHELAYAAVTFYLGVNLLTHLDEDRSRTDAVFEQAQRLAPLLSLLLGERAR